MNATWIRNVELICPGERISAGSLLIADGKIAQLNPSQEDCPPDAEIVEGGGRQLSPGLIDLHTHGIHRFQYEMGPDDVRAAAKLLGGYGTTCILPTIVPNLKPDFLRRLERIAESLPSITEVAIPGLHLEGPFMMLPGAACSTVPGDVKLLEELIEACHGKIRAMSLSPDVPNILPVIEQLVARGITPFMTHTRATVEQTEAAIEAGARHATHFYDVFPCPEETDLGVRPVGAVEAILADRRVSVDFVGDGCHVHPVAIRATLAAKGYAEIVLITDSSIGAGLPPGEYQTPWGYAVRVREGDAARIADSSHPLAGALAGSALTMNKGIANLLAWLELPSEQVWAMGTRNPARVIGEDRKGVIRVGVDADLVLWGEAFKPLKTWVAGQCIYEANR